MSKHVTVIEILRKFVIIKGNNDTMQNNFPTSPHKMNESYNCTECGGKFSNFKNHVEVSLTHVLNSKSSVTIPHLEIFSVLMR